MFRALRHRNYLLFFSGQLISLIGTWLQQIAISWLVYKLTNSALLMGVITFVGLLPSLILSPFAGVYIDRINKHKMLIIVQILFMLEALLLAVLTIFNVIQLWHVVVVCSLIGVTAAIDMPLRQAFVVQLVDDEADLGNAISLNSSMFNLARMIGPAIAGILISTVGEGYCFLINSLSYIAVISTLFCMSINYTISPKTEKENILGELVEGFYYAHKIEPIRKALWYLAISSFIGMSSQVLMPIFAKEILHGGAQTLGFLMSSAGIGALFGALKLASRKDHEGLNREIFLASITFAIALGCLSFMHNLPSALALMFLVGYGMVTIMAASNTIIQTNVEESKRGRVMSLYTVAFMGTAPLGSLFEGAVAEHIGVPYTFLLNGVIMFVFAMVFNGKTAEKSVSV